MQGSIRLSPQYGVNPSVELCFYCNEDTGAIVLPGRLPGDAEAPHKAIWSMEPCDKCKGLMSQGVILISARSDETNWENPYRTGGWVVMSEDWVKRVVTPTELADSILKRRMAFVPDDAWRVLGLPTSDYQREIFAEEDKKKEGEPTT